MKQRFAGRQFIRTAAAGITLPWIIPASVLGAQAPSNRITVGFIGTGVHGTEWNLMSYLWRYNNRVLVVCDVDGHHMRRAKKLVDARHDNEDCATTKDFREVLDRKDIDVVMISTPDHWHTLISVMAMRAGKDVQCEKPTWTIGEGKILIETCRKLGRVFQTGTLWQGGLYNTAKDFNVTFRYANGVAMTCTTGEPSIKFIGADGWVGNRGWRGELEASSPKILNSVIGPEEIHLYTNPEGEHDDFLKCVKSRKDPYFPVDIGHRVSSVCHLANISLRLRRKLKWDPQAERFESDDQANAMLSRPMRKPWSLAET